MLAALPVILADTASSPTLPVRMLASGVYAVMGDTGRGSEGRPNAGFIVTSQGVVVIDALASPRDGERLLRTIQATTSRPVKWLVLTHHHPDHHFGAIVFRRAGARVIAHPDRRVLAADAGPKELVREWTRVVGRSAMQGFEYADTPDRPVTSSDTLRLGGRTIVIFHPGAAHTAGDLMVWLPADRVLFAGDILVEDGMTMVVDGSSTALLHALDLIDSMKPAAEVPGHGAIPVRPADLVARTRAEIDSLRAEMRDAVEHGVPMGRALATFPPVDATRPVSLNSRRRRNAVRIYLEEERSYMGLDSTP
jgi:glyoxylase-like metal-dependent hydrolase (beta-lactamase superfamily II)